MLQRVTPASTPNELSPGPQSESWPKAPGESRGLAAPEVTAAAGIAAGLPWQGPLTEETPQRLYYLAAAAQASGRLTLVGETGAYGLTFKKGTPEYAQSTYPEDDLAKFLVQRGVLRPEQVTEAQSVKADFGGDLVGALLGLRLVNAADIFRVLQEYGIALVWRALASESKTGRWEPGVHPPASSFPLGAPWALFCDAVRRIDVARVRLRLGDKLKCSALRVGGRIAIEALRLTSQETRLYGLFDGVHSIEELAAARPNEMEVVLRLALLLSETEFLAFGAERRPGSGPAPVAQTQTAPPATSAAPPQQPLKAAAPVASPPAASPARPAAPRSAAPTPNPPVAVRPAAAPAAPAMDLPKLQEMAARLKGADHFQVLNVSRSATAAQIKVAYFQLAKLYHPDAGAPDDSLEVRKLRVEVFARLGESWGVLGNDQQRAEYLQQLESGGLDQVDVSAIFEAERLFELSMVLVKTRQYAEAAKKLAEAIQLNANEPEFGVWQAWVNFLLSPEDKKVSQQRSAANIIEAALRQNPKCMPAYLFLGQMAKLVGDAASAEKHFKRGLAQNPDHVELQRELKYLRRT